jgi:hypothetical protein
LSRKTKEKFWLNLKLSRAINVSLFNSLAKALTEKSITFTPNVSYNDSHCVVSSSIMSPYL